MVAKVVAVHEIVAKAVVIREVAAEAVRVVVAASAVTLVIRLLRRLIVQPRVQARVRPKVQRRAQLQVYRRLQPQIHKQRRLTAAQRNVRVVVVAVEGAAVTRQALAMPHKQVRAANRLLSWQSG